MSKASCILAQLFVETYILSMPKRHPRQCQTQGAKMCQLTHASPFAEASAPEASAPALPKQGLLLKSSCRHISSSLGDCKVEKGL